MRWYRQLRWQIIAGLLLGVVYGVVAASAGQLGKPDFSGAADSVRASA